MNKKGYSDKDFLNIIKTVAGLILLYIVYKAIMSQLGGG